MSQKWLIAFVVASALCCQAHAGPPTPTISLTPGGTVSGDPGQAVGWGFSFTNTTDYAMLTSSAVTISSGFGTYTDFLSLPSAPLIIAGPSPESTTVAETFDAATDAGLGSFTIDPGAAPGSQFGGDMIVHYALFSVDPNDPNFDPSTDLLVADATLSEPVTVDVNAAPVPEPASGTLLASMLAGLLLLMPYHKRRASVARMKRSAIRD